MQDGTQNWQQQQNWNQNDNQGFGGNGPGSVGMGFEGNGLMQGPNMNMNMNGNNMNAMAFSPQQEGFMGGTGGGGEFNAEQGNNGGINPQMNFMGAGGPWVPPSNPSPQDQGMMGMGMGMGMGEGGANMGFNRPNNMGGMGMGEGVLDDYDDCSVRDGGMTPLNNNGPWGNGGVPNFTGNYMMPNGSQTPLSSESDYHGGSGYGHALPPAPPPAPSLSPSERILPTHPAARESSGSHWEGRVRELERLLQAERDKVTFLMLTKDKLEENLVTERKKQEYENEIMWGELEERLKEVKDEREETENALEGLSQRLASTEQELFAREEEVGMLRDDNEALEVERERLERERRALADQAEHQRRSNQQEQGKRHNQDVRDLQATIRSYKEEMDRYRGEAGREREQRRKAEVTLEQMRKAMERKLKEAESKVNQKAEAVIESYRRVAEHYEKQLDALRRETALLASGNAQPTPLGNVLRPLGSFGTPGEGTKGAGEANPSARLGILGLQQQREILEGRERGAKGSPSLTPGCVLPDLLGGDGSRSKGLLAEAENDPTLSILSPKLFPKPSQGPEQLLERLFPERKGEAEPEVREGLGIFSALSMGLTA